MSVKETFVLVIGAPRTGTSLACDMVRCLGFNFGVPEVQGKDFRVGRHELLNGGQDQPNDWLEQFKKNKITALKLVFNIREWYEKISKEYEVKVVITTRNYNDWNKSASEKSPIEYSQQYYFSVMKQINEVLALINPCRVVFLPFEWLIKKNDYLIQSLSYLLKGGSSPVMLKDFDRLKALIHPQVVRYKTGLDKKEELIVSELCVKDVFLKAWEEDKNLDKEIFPESFFMTYEKVVLQHIKKHFLSIQKEVRKKKEKLIGGCWIKNG